MCAYVIIYSLYNTHIHIRSVIHTNASARARTHTRTYTHSHTYTCAHAHTYTHTFICMYECIIHHNICAHLHESAKRK